MMAYRDPRGPEESGPMVGRGARVGAGYTSRGEEGESVADGCRSG